MEEIWRRNRDSEDELDIRYIEDNDNQEDNQDVQEVQAHPQSSHQPTDTTIQIRDSDSDNSEDLPLSKTPIYHVRNTHLKFTIH